MTFIDIVRNHVDEKGEVRCPCCKCKNFRLQQLEIVKEHIHEKGFNKMYTKWIYHGESEEILPYTVNDVPESVDEIYAILDDVVDHVQNDDP